MRRSAGFKYMTPAKLTFHQLTSSLYYTCNQS